MTYVLSDIHGYYDKYQAMLRRISLCAKDTLYVLGDMIDRGPDGIRVLMDMMARPNVVPLLGNHEFTAAVCLPWLMEEITDESLAALEKEHIAALSEWVLNGGMPTLWALRQLSQEEREDLLDYLREMELCAEVDAGEHAYLLVHAGLEHYEPGKPLDAYELEDFLYARPDLEMPYDAGRTLIFGHTPTRVLREQLGEPPSDEILRRGRQIAIDCGCAFGGKLGCLCLETQEVQYV